MAFTILLRFRRVFDLILVVRVLIERFIERQCGFNVFRPDMDDDRFFGTAAFRGVCSRSRFRSSGRLRFGAGGFAGTRGKAEQQKYCKSKGKISLHFLVPPLLFSGAVSA